MVKTARPSASDARGTSAVGLPFCPMRHNRVEGLAACIDKLVIPSVRGEKL